MDFWTFYWFKTPTLFPVILVFPKRWTFTMMDSLISISLDWGRLTNSRLNTILQSKMKIYEWLHFENENLRMIAFWKWKFTNDCIWKLCSVGCMTGLKGGLDEIGRLRDLWGRCNPDNCIKDAALYNCNRGGE